MYRTNGKKRLGLAITAGSNVAFKHFGFPHQRLRVEVGVVLPLGLVLRRPLVLQHRQRVDAPEIHHLHSVRAFNPMHLVLYDKLTVA